MNVDNVFLDFGGTIDAPGIHPRVLFWSAFEEAKLFKPEEREAFQNAYTLADQKMMKDGSAKQMNLQEFNAYNAELIFGFLNRDASNARDVASAISRKMASNIQLSKMKLENLFLFARLGIISNFTGNLEVILAQFELTPMFQSITESFYVGASKPETAIFQAALRKQQAVPETSLYVGDNEKNDMLPAKALGFKTVLIRPKSEATATCADFIIHDLSGLEELIQRK